ncbi:MAG: hypothetical protein NTU43_00895, partial [Bacteroidetes bacterium]|nr:hypothetical protein [Bacteroidota bacterium]
HTLDVLKIENGSDLVLYCYSPVSLAITTPVTLLVNYHPSYRLYIDQIVGTEFVESSFLPASTDTKDVKQTFLALKAKDTLITNPISSGFSNFASIVAIKPIVPVSIQKPETKPIKFATRPDIFGKSSYTFDIKIVDKPFALQFYRANEYSVINALYEQTTVDSIYSQLKTIKDGILDSNTLTLVQKKDEIEIEESRMEEFINSIFNQNNTSEYNTFHSYKLPFPDKSGLFVSGDSLSTKKEKIKGIIHKLFIPVCSQPCIYDFIKSPDNKNTSSIAPVIKKANGDLLDIKDETEFNLFNPFPFIIKLKKGSDDYIRFTDYTLDGNSSVRYFYFAKDIAKNLTNGNPSPTIGPVNLINTTISEQPIIEKVETIVGNSYLNIRGGFVFDVMPYSETSLIGKFELYRTYDLSKINSIRLMDKVGEFDSTEIIKEEFSLETIVHVEDEFYYRILPYKKVLNENLENEWISGLASKPITVKLPDFINPPSPQIDPLPITVNNTKTTLTQVKLNFNSVMYKGKYYLYQLNNSSNWQLINTIENTSNTNIQQFSIGDVVIKENNQWIYKQYKIVAENRSGLLSLDEKIFNLTSFVVPTPIIIGPKVAIIAQSRTYKIIPSKSTNTLVWKKEGNTFSGNANSEVTMSWSSNGNKVVTLSETDHDSGIVVEVSLSIQVKPVPTPNISTNDTFLIHKEGVFSTQNVVGNYYLWEVDGGVITSGQGTNSITIYWVAPGTKNITLTESNGATSENTSIVQEIPVPYITIDKKPYINNTDTIFTVHNISLIGTWNSGFCDITSINSNKSSVHVSWQGLGEFYIEYFIDSNYTVLYSSKVLPIPINRTLPLVEGCDFDNLGFYRKLHKYKIINLLSGNNNPLITDIKVENGELLYDLPSIITNINNGSISFIDVFWSIPNTSYGALVILDSDVNDPVGQEYITEIDMNFGTSREMIVGNSNTQVGNTDIYTIEFGYFDTQITYVWDIDDTSVGQITTISSTTISVYWLKPNRIATISLNGNIFKRLVNVLDQNIIIIGNTSPQASTSETYTISGSNINPNCEYSWELDDSFIASGAISINSSTSTDINLGFNTPGVYRILLKEIDSSGKVNYYELVVNVV